MSVHRPVGTQADHPDLAAVPGGLITGTAAKALAVLRVATGFVFLWAFLDKTFGLGYSTPSSGAWVRGGSPTKGFLSSVDVGPFQSIAHSIAGDWWADWLFMLGMLGIGVAVIAGVGLRLAASVGIIILAMMWFTELPLARHTAGGDPSGSTNPLTDYHAIYAAALVVLATTFAGDTWGLGRLWARLPIVRDHRWLR